MTILNQSNVKSQMSLVRAAIKETLKVDAGPQSAYHVLAVANFFKNDQQMKATLKKSLYSFSANFGTKEYPCIIKHEIGLFENDYSATHEAESFLRNCQKYINWTLLKNNEDTGIKITSIPRPEKGLYLEVQVSGEKISDIECTIENLLARLEHGEKENRFGNPSNQCSFAVYGEEYDFIADVDCLVSDHPYVIFDSKGVIQDFTTEDDAYPFWQDRENEIDEWEDFLIYGEFVELHQALGNDEHIYHAVSRQSGTIYSGEIIDILDALKHENAEFSLFMEIDRA